MKKPYLITRILDKHDYVQGGISDGRVDVFGFELKAPTYLGEAPTGRALGDFIYADPDAGTADISHDFLDNPLEQHVPITYLFQATDDDHRLELFMITLVGPYLPGVHIARALIAQHAGIPEARLNDGSHALSGEVRKVKINSKGYIETSTCTKAGITAAALHPATVRRLAAGARALALPEPSTYEEAREQIEIISDGLRALQSLDDLGEEANAQAERDFKSLAIMATLRNKQARISELPAMQVAEDAARAVKILETETVVRYLVEFDETETILLKKLGQLPEHAQPCARLRLTSEELDESRLMLADGDVLLQQLYGKAESRS